MARSWGFSPTFTSYGRCLLEKTFQPSDYSSEQVFVATDLNLYYGLRHTHWYKRPDWFIVMRRMFLMNQTKCSHIRI